MLGWIERVLKSVKEKYDLEYNPDVFIFVRPKYDKNPNDWWELKQLWFVYKPNQKTFKMPYKYKIIFKKFLMTGKKEDFPINYELPSTPDFLK